MGPINSANGQEESHASPELWLWPDELDHSCTIELGQSLHKLAAETSECDGYRT
jgi:hypothetical protein